MCTLTYIPTPGTGFILTSNRDESVLRLPALPPLVYRHNGLDVLYPKDTQAGGTWLAVAENGFTLCLLNGAFVKHIHQPPYKHSRGLVVTDFFTYNDVPAFVKGYDFSGIEPFTLVLIESSKTLTVHEVRWDGAKVFYTTQLPDRCHIWSSAMLYEPEVIEEREKWFEKFLVSHPNPSPDEMLFFHHFGGGDNTANRVLMNRNNQLKTISITSVVRHMFQVNLHHENLLTGEKNISALNIQKL